MPGAGSGLAAAVYLPAFRKIAAQAPYVLVIDACFLGAELAYAAAPGAAEAPNRASTRTLSAPTIRPA